MVAGLLVVSASAWAGMRLFDPPEADRAGAAPLATLSVIEDPVEVSTRSGEFEAVDEQQEIDAGSRVRTGEGALAEIDYFEGSRSRIGPNTSYEIVALEEAPKRNVIVGRIGLGETFHAVKELSGSGSRFEIQESNAIATVRGTSFAARCLPPLPCGIAVTEGTVLVTPSSGEAVAVGAGQRVTIDDEGLLGEVAEVSPDDPWLNRNSDLTTR